MWRIQLLTVIGVCSCASAFAQIKKHYTIADSDQFDKVEVNLSTDNGTCYVRPTPNRNPINVYGDSNQSNSSATCQNILESRIQHVQVNFNDAPIKKDGQGFAFNVFKTDSDIKKEQWHVYLSQKKPMKLNLEHGMGSAYIDLSGMKCEKLNITTASADVNIGYSDMKFNQTQMDTFCIRVDMGALNAQQLNLSRAKNIITDVGFGSAYLDFSDKNLGRSNVQANVGVGNLVIYLSEQDSPMIIHINDTPLCRVKMPEAFSEIKSNVFVNKSYREDAENLLTFNLDVAVGNILFKTK